MALRLGFGLVGIQRLVASGAPLGAEWMARFERLRARAGVSRPVRFLASLRVDVPLTVGWLRPVVLVPASALTGMTPAELELLVAHELWHVRRWDYLANLLQSVVEVALFFHPAVWWVSRRVRAEREACCDDGVVGSGVEPLAYARALAALEAHRAVHGGLVLASTGGALMWRVERLLKPELRVRSASSVWGGFAAAVAVLVAGAVFAGVPGGPSLSSRWLPPALAPYRAEIEAAAARHGVDADLLAIVVLAESGGNPRAVSPRGARGLMQLLPKTAETLAREAKLAYAPEKLDEPAYNLDLGARYLKAQLERFGAAKDPVALAIAAYNGGPEQAQAWAEGRAPLSSETAGYEQRVLGMWRERGSETSAAYQAWREKFRGRNAQRAVSPLSAGKVTLGFGAVGNPIDGPEARHPGVDLAASAGTPLRAPLDGVVSEVSSDPRRGTVVVLTHSGGLQTRYHHLGSVQVKPAERVHQGETFATVGTSGQSTGPHVHYEVLDLGEPIDPAAFGAK